MSLVEAGANLVSGIFGASTAASESRANRHEARRQFNAQMDYNKNLTQIRVEDALKAGINPLAALGQSANVSSTISAGGTSGAGEIIANTGHNVGKALQEALSDKQADDMYYDSRAKELDLEGKRLQNRILRQQLTPTRPGVDQEPPPSMEGEGTIFKPVYDIKGRPRLVVNQDFLEGDSDNAGYSATLASALADGQIDKISGRVVSPQLRMMIDDYYYNTTGHHIHNLSDLYISPSEIALANANAIEQAGGGFFKKLGKKLFSKTGGKR